MFIKTIIDRKGTVLKAFKNNVSCIDWVLGFVKRNQLTQRISDNVKAARAEVNEDIINNYFNELELSLEGIPATHIFNYDETNITDDPGKKHVVRGEGEKELSEKIEACKTNNILFICLPPNSTHLCQLLDVAVSRALKVEWKDILDTWHHKSKSKVNIPKTSFPSIHIIQISRNFTPNSKSISSFEQSCHEGKMRWDHSFPNSLKFSFVVHVFSIYFSTYWLVPITYSCIVVVLCIYFYRFANTINVSLEKWKLDIRV